MFAVFFLSLVTLTVSKPPPYVQQDSIYDNLPYLIDRAPLPLDEEVTHYETLLTQRHWPDNIIKFGQVSGVDTDRSGDVHVFHRAERAWTTESFGYGDVFKQKNDGPIKGETLLILDKSSGEVKKRFGKNKFFMPHGITIDHDENMWLTDVAMHQVFKYSKNADSPVMVLGEEFVPGSDDSHFCKPTDVAVASTGAFFVADGYCNSRIMKFFPNGTLDSQFGKAPTSLGEPKNDELRIPHSLTLIESLDVICVADREHGRIQCFRAGLVQPKDTGVFVASVDDAVLAKVFAVAYDPNNNLLYAVNGPNRDMEAVQGFTINPQTWQIVDEWGPQQGFSTPHDLAVSPDGKHVYVAEIGPNKLWKLDRIKL